MVRRLAGTFLISAVLAIVGVQSAQGQSWQLTDGAARDVGVGADGSVWVIGTNPVPGGYSIWRRVNNAWVNVPGGAERIAVDPQGNAWVVNNAQAIFRHDGSKWVTVTGAARDVGVGANGTVWIIGNVQEAGGYSIHRSTDKGASWTKIPGSAVRVSVDPQGNAWVVNSSNAIFRHDGNNWVHVAGAATDVGVGSDGATWVIGSGNSIWRWETNKWVQKTGAAAQVAAGPNGSVWVVNQGNQIWQASLPSSVVIPTPSTYVAAPSQPVTIPNPVQNIPAPGTGTTPIILSGGPGIVVATPGTGGTSPQPTQPNLTVGSTNLGWTYTPGKVGYSEASCGVPGKPFCGFAQAQLESNADVICPTGTFPDLGRSACFKCPDGFTRSIHPVDNYKACQKPDSTVKGGLLAATYQAPLCETGTFFDPIRGGECYSCPSGYRRSAAHITESNACYIPITENFSHATRKNKGLAWDCTGGSFWDPIDGGYCFTCPSGYRRTAYHVSDSKACAQTVGEQHKHATLVKKAECGPGEIKDAYVKGEQNPAYGGGCWTCPAGTDRTIHPIFGEYGCERAPGVQWANATRERGMTCEPDQIFDPVSSGNSNVARALSERNVREPKIATNSIGGTCWTCPPGQQRTGWPVYGDSACNPPGIVWNPAPYNQPGLFGLAGAEEVALALVTERSRINTILEGIRASAAPGTLPADYAKTIWDEIGATPQDSAVLKMAVYSRVVAAANEPANATAAEKALLEEVVKQIGKFRVFMAQDALDAYDAWNAGQEYRKGQYQQTQAQVLTALELPPPDFDEITAEMIMSNLAVSGASQAAVAITLSNPAVLAKLFPYASRSRWVADSGIGAAKTGLGIARQGRSAVAATKMAMASSKTAAKLAVAMAKLGKMIGTLAASAGPQIIATIGTEILMYAIEQQINVYDARPKLLANLAKAQNEPVNFPRLMATPEGVRQADGFWSTLMAGAAPRPDGSEIPAIAPRNPAGFAQQATVARQALVAQVQ
jgi:Tectonin domain